jgi:hypothetical protein
MKIQILALDGIFDTGLATVLDVFTTANELSAMLSLGIAPFDVRIVGLRRKVRTSQGLAVPVSARLDPSTADWLVTPDVEVVTFDAVAEPEVSDHRDTRRRSF